MIFLIIVATILVLVLVYDAMSEPKGTLRDSSGEELKPWASIDEISKAGKTAEAHKDVELDEAA